MIQKAKIKWLTRSVIYTLTINISVCVVMLLYAHNIIRDITSLIILFTIYVISATMFSVVKGNTAKPLLYNISTLVTHAVTSFVIISVLGYMYKGWETAMFLWTEIFTAVFFVTILLLDTIMHLLKRT